MFLAIRSRINATTVVAVLALLFAMTGGAYAAKKYLITSTKQISPSVLKSLQGKAGLAGANGAQGPAGPAGPAGAQGSAGSAGSKGETGTAGKDGKGLTTTAASIAECKEGGTKIQVEGSVGSSHVCNGSEGAEGQPGSAGSPWVVGEAPSGAVLKGTWVIPPATAAGSGEKFYTAISSGVPIPTPPAGEGGIAVVLAPVPVLCPEGSAEEPQAGAPGVLCVFVGETTHLGGPNSGNSHLKASHGGVIVDFNSSGEGIVSGYGSWAYKAP